LFCDNTSAIAISKKNCFSWQDQVYEDQVSCYYTISARMGTRVTLLHLKRTINILVYQAF
jgi:hypothetical protein